MKWQTIYTAVLIALALIMPTYILITNWQRHRQRRQTAVSRGWRYSRFTWQIWFQTNYVVAGTTRTGEVWEVTQVRRNGQRYFRWATAGARLPYGRLYILPLSAPTTPDYLARPHLQPATDHSLPDNYLPLTTHRQLGRRYLTAEIALSLAPWPAWPRPGSLTEVTWHKEGLAIYGRYHDDWNTLSRLVALGTALIEAKASG